MLMYGVVFVCVAWGVHVIVCFVCELLRAVVWCSLVVVIVCVRVGCVRLCGLCVIDFAMLKRLLLSG